MTTTFKKRRRRFGSPFFYLAMELRRLVKRYQNHSYHLVNPNPLPILASLVLGVLLSILPKFVLQFDTIYTPQFEVLLTMVVNTFIFLIMVWFCYVVYESAIGDHTKKVQKGLKAGMVLFIVSEIMFFFAFFWSYFHFSLNPSYIIGCIWPPLGQQELNILGLPLVNTILLLSSGFTITCSHFFLVSRKDVNAIINLFFTIILGIIFLRTQFIEYKYGIQFTWNGDLYGSVFFLTTGFHGLHVTLGTISLIFNLVRYNLTADQLFLTGDFNNYLWPNFQFTASQHVGFEACAWYWHFVDVIWIFLYIVVYWWGGF